ncbi:MAG: polymer-forming cytoskeletal protein [Alphaproteobacteria bacterium]|nr:polymer-forming cytoskeletal protein [Alphaproteobacteria bacterium]
MTIEKRTIRSDIPGHQAYLGPATPQQTQEDDRRLLIGPGIVLRGEIESCENLVVAGTVHAAGLKSRRIDIADTGLFAGTGEAQDAIISGHLDGELVVTGRLLVRATGRITGKVTYGSLEVEPGAKIEAALVHKPIEPAPQPPRAQKLPVPETSNVEKLFPASGVQTPALSEGRPKVYRRATGV